MGRWFDSKEAAEVLGVKPDSILKSAQRSAQKLKKICTIRGTNFPFRYADGKGGGGKKLQIYIPDENDGKACINELDLHLMVRGEVCETLKQVQGDKIQVRHDEGLVCETLKQVQGDKIQVCNDGFREPTNIKLIERQTPKIALLNAANEYVKQNSGTKTALEREFIDGYNRGVVCKGVFEKLGELSIQTLWRWQKMVRDSGVEALIPNYKIKSAKEFESSLSELEKSVIAKMLFSAKKWKIASAVKLARWELTKSGITPTGCEMTWVRYGNYLQSRYYDKWVLARDGEKALNDKLIPAIRRDESVLNVGDILVADGHTLNFMAIDPFDGKPKRPTIIVFLDWASRMICGAEIMFTENTQSVASALRNSIINLGKIPKVVYMDNGRAFKNKFFGAGAKWSEDDFTGMYGRLGIAVTFARPYNAQAKRVERAFGDDSMGIAMFERTVETYVGQNALAKPAYTMRNEKLHKRAHEKAINEMFGEIGAPSIEQIRAAFIHWMEFYSAQPHPTRSGTVGDIYIAGRGNGIDTTELDFLMMNEETRKVGRFGVRLFKADYMSNKLYAYNDNVLVRYSIFDLSVIRVYDLKGHFICEAQRADELTHPMAEHLGTADDLAGVKRALAQQKAYKKQTIDEAKQMPYLSDLIKQSKKLPAAPAKKEEVKEIKQEKVSLLTELARLKTG